MRTRLTRVALAAALLATAGCGGLSGGPRKVVVTETVCVNARFLRMKLNETNRVVLDNNKHSDTQQSLGLVLNAFPVTIQGAVPPGSTIGSPQSTIVLHADVGDEQSVDLVPTFTGTYTAQCNVTLKTDQGVNIVQMELKFEIVQ